MKPTHTLLIIILIISGFLPVPFLLACLFLQDSAVLMLHLGELNVPLENLLTINGAYMFSFVIVFWVAAAWLIRSHPGGLMLSLVLGLITVGRGILMLALFRYHGSEPPFLAIIATIDGSLIILLTFLAKRK